MKRFIAYATSALLGLGGVVAIAAPASAHHSTISATSVRCATEAGDYTVTWSVQNWNSDTQDLTARVTGSSRGVVPTGTAFSNNETKTFTETVSGKQSLGLEVSMRWSNGATATNRGSLSSSTYPDCSEGVVATAPSVSEPTCEAPGRLTVPADTAAIDYSQNPAGSGPGTYTVTATARPGYTISGKSSWTVTVPPAKSGDECADVVTAKPPTMTAPTCDSPGTVKLPTVEGVRYEITELGDNKVRVNAFAEEGHRLEGTAEWTMTVEGPKTGTECDRIATPVAPSIGATDECGEPGSLILPADDNVVYTLTAGNGIEGAYEVTATPAAGYRFADGVQTVFTGDLGSRHGCGVAGTISDTDPKSIVSSMLPDTGAPGGIKLLLMIGVGLFLAGGSLLVRSRLGGRAQARNATSGEPTNTEVVAPREGLLNVSEIQNGPAETAGHRIPRRSPWSPSEWLLRLRRQRPLTQI